MAAKKAQAYLKEVSIVLPIFKERWLSPAKHSEFYLDSNYHVISFDLSRILPVELREAIMVGGNASLTNETDASGFMQCVEDYLLTFLMILTIIVIILGNIFVVLAILTYKPLRNVQNVFLISLAVADLMVAILVMPLHISNKLRGSWKFGGPMCNFWVTCDVLLCTASILNLCVIALDRYFAIHDPLSYAQKRTMTRVLLMIVAAWVVSAVISVPPLFGWIDNPNNSLYKENTQQCSLTGEKGYIIYSSFGSFFIPLIIMTFVYIKIFFATRERLRKRAKASAASKMALLKNRSPPSPNLTAEQISEDSNENNEQHNREFSYNTTPNHSNHLLNERIVEHANTMENFFNQRQKISLSKERKAARTLGIIVGVFVLCWLPFFIMYVTVPFCTSCNLPPGVEMGITFLGYVNSALNPIIYTVFSVDFRKAFHFLVQKYLKFRRPERHNNLHLKSVNIRK
ncbi:probable G-protein coupled receptor No18 [Saccostrea cucullata]|uniref:probable G-protein coupled receptor No18 n=1 Tax=Saccostrea cuccullata TaxID=36930 RepID=UPI002ED09636